MTRTLVHVSTCAQPGPAHDAAADDVRRYAVLRTLRAFRSTSPFRWDLVLDDAAWAIEAITPNYASSLRLHDHVKRLADMAVSGSRLRPLDVRTESLVQKAFELSTSEAPATCQQAVAHLRSLGRLVGDLVDQLVAIRHISPPVPHRDLVSCDFAPSVRPHGPVSHPC